MKKKLWIMVFITAAFFVIGLRPAVLKGEGLEKAPMDYQNIFKSMFPKEHFSSTDWKSVQNSNGEIYYIEEIIYDKFTGSGKEEFLVVVKRPEEQLAHAQGFYNAYLAVFEKNNQRIVSTTQLFAADEGYIGVFRGQDKAFVFFAGSITYQGWTTWAGGLYSINETSWDEVWPRDADFWENRAVKIAEDKIVLYKRLTSNPKGSLIPESKFVKDKELLWDKSIEEFVEKGQ